MYVCQQTANAADLDWLTADYSRLFPASAASSFSRRGSHPLIVHLTGAVSVIFLMGGRGGGSVWSEASQLSDRAVTYILSNLTTRGQILRLKMHQILLRLSLWVPFTVSQSYGSSVTCHIGSHSVTCHPTQVNAPSLNPSLAGTRFTYPGGMEG